MDREFHLSAYCAIDFFIDSVIFACFNLLGPFISFTKKILRFGISVANQPTKIVLSKKKEFSIIPKKS